MLRDSLEVLVTTVFFLSLALHLLHSLLGMTEYIIYYIHDSFKDIGNDA